MIIRYYQYNNRIPTKNKDLVNENIPFTNVFLVDSEGKTLGIMSFEDAYKQAIQCDLDLVCVAPNAKPPICKILNYSKYRFENQKKAKKNKFKQATHTINVKEIQLTPQIREHDLLTKINHAKRFLEKGDKIKIVMRYHGRQLAHIDIGENILKNFIDRLKEISTIEKAPVLEGKNMTVLLASKFKK